MHRGPFPRVALSACLGGRAVRYDGRDKLFESLMSEWEGLVEWIHVCPEVEFGMPIPRPPIELFGDPRHPGLRVLPGREGKYRPPADFGQAMRRWAEERVARLLQEGIEGAILKDRSASCSTLALSVGEGAHPGLFAAELLRRRPDLPICGEGQLQSAAERREFLARCEAQRAER